MISYLKGKIRSKTDEYIIIDVNGVGYKVFLSEAYLKKIDQENGQVELYTYLYITEGAMELYGFLNQEEEEFFQSLIDVAGVGPKAAIKILDLGLNKIKQAIASEDVALLDSIPGIGKKKAERIVLDLKSKIKIEEMPKEKLSKFQQEAWEALVKLGYSSLEAKKALAKVPETVKETKAIVKEALKILGCLYGRGH